MLNGRVVLEGCRFGFRQTAYARSRKRIVAICRSFRSVADSQLDALIRIADFFKKLSTHARWPGLSKGFPSDRYQNVGGEFNYRMISRGHLNQNIRLRSRLEPLSEEQRSLGPWSGWR